jgi:hypothetical protein
MLSFAGTVELSRIHRRNPGEAFLTDVEPRGPYDFVAAARIPRDHPHYGAHTGPSRFRDPLLLLECARQAETYAAHDLFGVEPDAHFALRDWSAEFTSGAPDGDELLLSGTTFNPKLVYDRIRGLDYELHLAVQGIPAGRVRMRVSYLSDAAYAVVRTRQHPGPRPSSDTVVLVGGCPVAPARVGRIRATDTVLDDVAVGPRAVTARLRVPVENPSLFDHAQDHVPAMVLMEAARQLAALATTGWGGPPPDRTIVSALSASFAAYAELTEPVELVAVPSGDYVESAFRQAGAEIARARIRMVTP